MGFGHLKNFDLLLPKGKWNLGTFIAVADIQTTEEPLSVIEI